MCVIYDNNKKKVGTLMGNGTILYSLNLIPNSFSYSCAAYSNDEGYYLRRGVEKYVAALVAITVCYKHLHFL